MSEIAISVRNISKSFRMYNSPAERLKELLHPFKKKYHKNYVALKDISFDVQKGTTLGVIGRNGCGKSTLLQIICGILQPTTGTVSAKGRISALLELGAGFNKNFTGRENVFMNGAVLGISRAEMESRFEQIAEFADIGHFIDQPVKTYSSGMYLRLAFSVAINVDPDILVIDEALAVGDIKFQRKCFSKIEDFRDQKKTILFVSHTPAIINNLCSSAVLIDKGIIVKAGEPRVVSKLYHQLMFGENIQATDDNRPNISEFHHSDIKERNMPVDQGLKNAADFNDEHLREYVIKTFAIPEQKSSERQLRHGSRKAEIIDFGIFDKNEKRVNYLVSGEKYTFFFRCLFYESFKKIFFAFIIRDVQGIELFYTNTQILNISVDGQKRGNVVEALAQITMWLAPGQYFLSFVSLDLVESNYLDRRLDAFHFTVTSNPNNGGGFINLCPQMQIINNRIFAE